ncbi:MAG: hypothetical protein ACKO5C_07915, partial [Ferruginibacter sp.]
MKKLLICVLPIAILNGAFRQQVPTKTLSFINLAHKPVTDNSQFIEVDIQYCVAKALAFIDKADQFIELKQGAQFTLVPNYSSARSKTLYSRIKDKTANFKRLSAFKLPYEKSTLKDYDEVYSDFEWEIRFLNDRNYTFKHFELVTTDMFSTEITFNFDCKNNTYTAVINNYQVDGTSDCCPEGKDAMNKYYTFKN